MNTELLPCPFCGKTDSLWHGTNREIEGKDNQLIGYGVVCDYRLGGCGAASGYRKTIGDAIKEWNRRANNEN